MEISLSVGGVSYCVPHATLASYPDSFFGRVLKDDWRGDAGAPLTIDRNGALFRHVLDFMTYKSLPRNKKLECLLDEDTLLALHDEADFYQLTDLANDINEVLHYPEKAMLDCHQRVESIINDYVNPFAYPLQSITMLDAMSNSDSDIVKALLPFYVPSCVQGMFYCNIMKKEMLYKSSSLKELNIQELLANAKPSHFGRNTETVFDRSVRDSFEIPASKLNKTTLRMISHQFKLYNMSRTMELEARPYKLVIYPEGGHFAPHRDTVRGDNHVGTVVCILNSEFTGGEFLIHTGGETIELTHANTWVAMFGDCMHEIRPVTSGYRVSLIYDIYCTGELSADDDLDDSASEDERIALHAVCVGSGITEEHKEELIAATQKVGSPFCVTLQHLYPPSQSTTSFLKGGDRILFDTLNEHFSVKIVPIVYCKSRSVDGDDSEVHYALFKTSELKADGCGDEVQGQKESRKRARKAESFPLFIPWKKLSEKDQIFHQEPMEYTGNESQDEKNAYLVRGLFVVQKPC